MLIASVDASKLAVEFANPFPLSLLDIECVTSIDFFQDGNGKVSDVVVTLTEVLASGLADITIFNVSKDQGPSTETECHLDLTRFGLGLQTADSGL